LSLFQTIPLYVVALLLLAGAALLGWFARSFQAAGAGIAALVFVSSLGIRVTWDGDPVPTWIGPLQVNRTLLVFSLSGLLMAGLLMHAGRLRWYLSGSALTLLVIGIYAGLLRMQHEDVVAGLGSIALAVLMRVPLMGLTPALVDTDENAERFFRWLVRMMLVWCATVLVQVFINRGVMFGNLEQRSGFRFTGLSPNPQSAALFLSVMGGISLWVTLNGFRRATRMLAGVVTAATLIMLAWTGSRTGALMFFVIGSAVVYSRLKAVILAPILAIVTYALWWIATAVLDIDFGLKRLASTEDTRTAAWRNMWEIGAQNPVFGVGADETGGSENSLLYGFSSYGLGMVVLILLLIAICLRQSWQLWRIRNELSPFRKQLAHLTVGFNLCFLAGATFEGFIIARISVMAVFMFLFSGIAARLIAEHGRGGTEQEGMQYDGAHLDYRHT
jgi:hypothetical protein